MSLISPYTVDFDKDYKYTVLLLQNVLRVLVTLQLILQKSILHGTVMTHDPCQNAIDSKGSHFLLI